METEGNDSEEEIKIFNMGLLHRFLGTSELNRRASQNIMMSLGLFFTVCVISEIFSNISGTSLIYLFWETDFLFSHGIYIVICKVGVGTVMILQVYQHLLFLVLRRGPPLVSPNER